MYKLQQTPLISILIFICISTSSLSGQKEKLQFENLNTEIDIPPATITCIFQDSKGFLWFGGYSGLYRYDGHETKHFENDSKDSTSINDHRIVRIIEDKINNLWIATQSGLSYFIRSSERFVNLNKQFEALNDIYLTTLLEDRNGQIWIGTQSGILIYDPKKEKLVPLPLEDEQVALDSGYNISIYQDKNKNIWISNLRTRVIVYNPSTQEVNYPFQGNSLLDKLTISAYYADNSILWLGTDVGLIKYDLRSSNYQHYVLEEQEFLGNNCQAIVEGKNNNLWIGTKDGLVLFNKTSNSFHRYQTSPEDQFSLNHNYIYTILKDHSNSMWIGTQRGVSRLNPQANVFKKFPNNNRYFIKNVSALRSFIEIDTNKLLLWGGNELELFDIEKDKTTIFPFKPDFDTEDWDLGINCFMIDQDNQIWMGTPGGGIFIFNPINKSFKHLKDQLSSTSIRDMVQAKNGDIWIATWFKGVNRYNPKEETFEYYLNVKDYHLSGARNLFLDSKNTLWVGTRGGLRKFNPQKSDFDLYAHNPNDPSSISENTSFDMFEDQDGNLWLGSYGGGLNMLDIEADTFSHFTIKDGLADNNIFSLLPDQKGNIWMHTFKGISKFNLEDKKFTNYNYKDGLLSKGYDGFGYYKSPFTGIHIYEGEDGLDIFHPDSIIVDSTTSKVVLTGLEISNKNIQIASEHQENNGFFLPSVISELDELVLRYSQNQVTFKFSAMHFANPIKNQFKYKLEGFDDDWNEVGNQNFAPYTNISPGEYTFKVKASNADGIWNDDFTSIILIVTPPWWQTSWAYLLYSLAGLFILLAILRYQRRRLQLENQLVLEKEEAERLKEFDLTKTRLYTNITHEFRTPLTVISGMADQIKKSPEKWLDKGLQMITKNSNRLLDLVNQMLDLRKLEIGAMSLELIQGDILQYLKYCFGMFNSLADGKDIRLHFISDLSELEMDFDREKILRIISNLVSNAIKFTPNGGDVYLQVFKNESILELKVRDTGIGIPSDKIPLLFDRFYQVDDSTTRKEEGTGIGLALTKELVDLMKGTISVESEVKKGSVFIVQLPITNKAPIIDKLILPLEASSPNRIQPLPESTIWKRKKTFLWF